MKKYKRKLYLEIYSDTKTILSPEEQESGNLGRPTELIGVSYMEYLKYLEYFNKHNSCKHHLVYDVLGFMYDVRYCDICGKLICII